ncbi:alpha/beta fold hydrolase [Humibacter ginsenosidimutans]|uniref:Alpha/beta fold hydrolase n=1 Tax=Humibacter ginsenosidimutans TaxID=2599293 RepID=A0A5B8M4W2_9MICO|nr:alpha/beta fold hydrolase [Humibacter ginsenosidimutans]QDZ15261.1 alpha/beta fold hydrolase [Humibacter ginsenosidimutans]
MPDSAERDVETQWVATPAGDRVAYDVRGDGPAVILVAGAGPYRGTDPNTPRTADLLAERGIRTLLYDRVGRGESVADGPFTLDRELAALSALIDVVGGHAVLWGQSSGGAIALRAAVDGLPVDGLALWETPLQQADDAAAWAREFAARIDAGDLLGALEHYSRDVPPERLRALKESPRLPQILATVPSQRADAEALAWADEALESGSFERVAAPVLAMTGEVTRPAMAHSAAVIASAVQNGRAATVAGARHQWEPEAMAVAIAAFVRTL